MIAGDGLHPDVSEEIASIPSKFNPLVANDVFLIEDSEDSFAKKKLSAKNLPAIKSLFWFEPNQATFPSTKRAGATSRNGHPLLAFDDGLSVTDEVVIFHGVMPQHYLAGSITWALYWVAKTATTGNVVWGIQIERLADGGQDIDSDGFDSQTQSAQTTSGTSGVTKRSALALSQSGMDDIEPGDAFRLKLTRVSSSGSDTMVGDAQISRIQVHQ